MTARWRTALICFSLAALVPIPAFAERGNGDGRRPPGGGPALYGNATAALGAEPIPVEKSNAEVLPDKLLHGLAGASGALLAAAIASAAVGEGEPRTVAATVAAVGFGSAALIGLAKELLDLGGLGDPELMDVVCTVLGGFVVSAGVWALLREHVSEGFDPSVLAPPFGAFGVVLALPVADAWITSRRQSEGTQKNRKTTRYVLPRTPFSDRGGINSSMQSRQAAMK